MSRIIGVFCHKIAIFLQQFKPLEFLRKKCYNKIMNVFSISDLHLSGLSDKPMDVFGKGWENHFEKIKSDWRKKVLSDDDIVLIAGDVSWGTTLEEGLFDLEALKELKGRKVFVRGNHDFWWNGITRLRRAAPDGNFYFLQNDCVKFENVIICGSRGWTCPGSNDYSDTDEKLYKREAERFKLCFKEVEKVREEGDRLIVMIHYPPFSKIIRIILSSDNNFRAEKSAMEIGMRLKDWIEKLSLTERLIVMGPAPCVLEKIRGEYRFNLIVKNKLDEKGHNIILSFLRKVILPNDIKMIVDVDPMDIL